jgi:hypothetical protein
VRDINTQLFKPEERESFETSIKMMIMMGLKIAHDSNEKQEVTYEPDIGSLILFMGNKKINMRTKLQIMIQNNYNPVKNGMMHPGVLPKDPNQKGEKDGKDKPKKFNALGFLYESKAQNKLEAMKKRKREDMMDTEDRSAVVQEGSFKYKFQVGHT